MTAATTPATDIDIINLTGKLKAGLTNLKPSDRFTMERCLYSLIARIHQEREKAVRECAEIARTFEDWGDYSGDLETASAQIRTRILALLPTPPALSQEERT